MRTYKDAKRELELRIECLKSTINFLKQNSFYEDYCDNCHSLMKINLRQYGEPKKFCTNKCRNQAHIRKKKDNSND